MASKAGARTVVCADPIAAGLLATPGECGADIAVGEGQSLGLPMSYGGPGLGLLAVRQNLIRRLPGRVAGRTVDADGNPGYVLTLQTREQHIRREKATSNICTNQALCALAATVYLSALGPGGLRRIAALCVTRTHELYDAVSSAGLQPLYPEAPFFREFAAVSPVPVRELQKAMGARGFILGGDISEVTGTANSLLLSATEQRTPDDIAALAAALREVL
jgi:glycine dehydrogenase subunit 1